MRSGTSVPPRVARWWAAALVLTMLGVGCVLLWADRPPEAVADAQDAPAAAPTTPGPATPGPAKPEPEAPVEPTVGPAVDAAVAPVRLAIPAMALDTRLITLGLQPDETVEVPSDPDQAGWYRLGTMPGSVGSSVILGHVDSVDGPAVFSGLADLAPGVEVQVELDDGSVSTFAVRSVTTYDNEAFPAKLVYGSHGRRELNLVTCGGEYDAARGGYQSNVVVNARWVSTVAATT